MKTSKVIGVVITDGVGYRNFVLSDFTKEVVKSFERVVIYSGIPIKYMNLGHLPEHVEIIELDIYKEERLVWFARKVKEISHMYLHRSFFGINDNLIRGFPKKNSLRAILIKIAYLISYLFHSENDILFFEKIQYKLISRSKYVKKLIDQLKDKNLDQLFFTHQRPSYLSPVLSAAKLMGVRTSAFIFSWDNMASKGRMLGSFDGYLVWSELMKKELKYFYPKTDENNIHIVGTPQFEPYVLERYKVKKQDFFNKMELDLSKEVICYSCADADIGRNDEVHIRALQTFIEQNPKFQLLIRTSPAEDGSRFKNLMDEFPSIKWNIPKWILSRDNHEETWSQRLPTIEDVLDLKSILKYCLVNVNMLSTMSLDFMIFDKPVINTVFGNESNGLYNDQRFLNYKHYEYVVDSGAVSVSKNQTELHKQLSKAIEYPLEKSANRKKLIELEIGAPLEGTSKRIINALKTL